MLKHLALGLSLVAVAVAGQVQAQEAGGIAVAPEVLTGISGLAQLPAFVFPTPTAADIQGTVAPADRAANHRNRIAKVRGDGGFLDGFAFGQPVALSRVPVGPPVGLDFNIVNRFSGPVFNGSNNIFNQVAPNGRANIANQITVCDVLAEGEAAAVELACGGSTNTASSGGDADEEAPRPRR
jgi:hypothetical protein